MADTEYTREQADKMVRYCPECGLIGPVPATHETCCPDSFGMQIRRWQAEKMERMLARLRAAIPAASLREQPTLSVWFGAMPESNGKANWTAILHREDLACGHTIDRSEHYDRVRYEADRVRWLIGELPDEPDLSAYDGDMLWPAGWQHPCDSLAPSSEGDEGSGGGKGTSEVSADRVAAPAISGDSRGCLPAREESPGAAARSGHPGRGAQ